MSLSDDEQRMKVALMNEAQHEKGRIRALKFPRSQVRSRSFMFACIALAVSSFTGCFETEKGEPFYGRVETPRAQEFRWSDGGLPSVFDPALAAAPPDTDAVRALFEGLTDNDPVSLEPVAAVAMKWEASADYRSWTFYLRRDARWSNGDAVTARDFVRSWQRTLRLGDRAPHVRLLENIEGAQSAVALVTQEREASPNAPAQANGEGRAEASPTATATPTAAPSSSTTPLAKSPADAATFGAEAVNDYVLNVRLKRPDVNFPALVAHPVFRPVHEIEANAEAAPSGARDEETTAREVVSNGAFRLSGRAADSVLLERASNYWDAGAVALERVRFVSTRDGEAALNAYRNGEVDAVTNAAFEPLALKLLAPYKDFHRATYGALTYYSFNLNRAPFDDIRVREALAIALDRDRLCADTMGGATEPAKKFLPEPPTPTATSQTTAKETNERASGHAQNKGPQSNDETEAQVETDAEPSEVASARGANVSGEREKSERVAPLEANVERARRLLAEAGFAGGLNFPRIRLLVNRNDQHRVMAQAVAAMWRSVLGVETEVVVRGWDEYEAALWTGEYDIARRSIVMQTMDEESNMRAMFGREQQPEDASTEAAQASAASSSPTAERADERRQGEQPDAAKASASKASSTLILSEAQALRELPAIPVYFASSYALVKPYVAGFDANLLDVPSLKRVRLNTDWKPPEETQVIRVVSNR